MKPYFENDDTLIYCGDALEIIPLLKLNSMDLVVTSPPYFAQREYTDGDIREVGTECNPVIYLQSLWQVTNALAQCLCPDGSLVVNLGDKVNADGPVKRVSQKAGTFDGARRQPRYKGVSLKSLMLLPHRYAIGCIDQLGLCLRSEIIWSKGHGNHDAKAAGRARRSHEILFQFTRRLRHGEATQSYGDPGTDVWTIPTSHQSDHPATFPLEIPRRCIAAWSPPRGVVLDPFMGRGTTLIAAKELGRRAIGIDIREDYCEIAAKRSRG